MRAPVGLALLLVCICQACASTGAKGLPQPKARSRAPSTAPAAIPASEAVFECLPAAQTETKTLAAPSSSTWLATADHRGCCEYQRPPEPPPDGWSASVTCVAELAPGLERGPQPPRLITLEGRDIELTLSFDARQTSLTTYQHDELVRYAQMIAERSLQTPSLIWTLPAAKPPATRLAALTQQVSAALAEAHLSIADGQPSVTNVPGTALGLRLSSYLPRPADPPPCRSGATLRAGVLPLSEFVRVEICRGRECSHGRATLTRDANAFVFPLKGAVEAALFVARSGERFQLEVRAAHGAERSDWRRTKATALTDGDVYRLTVWSAASERPVLQGERSAQYEHQRIGDRVCSNAVLDFATD